MSDTPAGLPSSEAIGGMINTLMSNPDLLKNIMGALGSLNTESEKDGDSEEADQTQSEEKKDETAAAAGTIQLSGLPPELISKLPMLLSLLGGLDGAPKSKRETEREALLCALKPYLSPSRAEALDKIIKISRLGDLLGSL